MERNFPMEKKFFSYEDYEKLLKNIGVAEKAGDADAKLDIQSVQKAFQSFHDYVNAVDMSETQIKLAYARYEGADIRDAVQRYDLVRRSFHEAAVANVSLVNNLARFYGTDKIFIGDPADRYQVADFCLEVTVKIFQNRRI